MDEQRASILLWVAAICMDKVGRDVCCLAQKELELILQLCTVDWQERGIPVKWCPAPDRRSRV